MQVLKQAATLKQVVNQFQGDAIARVFHVERGPLAIQRALQGEITIDFLAGEIHHATSQPMCLKAVH
jgi:hypothetical protein